MGKTTKIRLTEEEARAQEEAERPKEPIKLTPKQQDQLAFKTGNRRTRRAIAKRNKFFKDHSGQAWRKSNVLRLGGRFNAAKPLLYAGTVD